MSAPDLDTHTSTHTTRYRTTTVDGHEIFSREAGAPDAPALLLLHGFPSSSHMFRDLIPALAGELHLVAPDYPGFGNSDMPPVERFSYTFDHLADIIEHFVVLRKLRRFALYAQDFGGPVGFRLAARRPAAMNPDAWNMDQHGLDRPGHAAIQLALHTDYATNVERYPEWHPYFAKHQPPTLIVWGKGDPVVTVEGAKAYQRHLRDVELHLLDTGHFALEEDHAAIAAHIRRFFRDRRLR